MKRVYALLPGNLGARLRNVLEFDGGITDTYLSTSKAGHDTWNVITGGSRVFRAPPAAQPQPQIPTNAGPQRVTDIKYYSRDVRRNLPVAQQQPLEASFTRGTAALLPSPPALVEKPEEGSPGMKNPDVFRYDPTGLRSTMTANWTSLARSLDAARPNHLPRPAWSVPTRARGGLRPTPAAAATPARFATPPQRVPDTRKRGWAWTQANEY